MRILVCSDSHGRADRLLRAVELQPTAEIIVFLGDGEADSDQLLRLPGRTVYRVCGNGDRGSQLPGWELFTAAGQRVLCTHGHLPRVEWSLDSLWYTARERGVDIALFGHTHMPFYDYDEDCRLHLFNPGAICDGCCGFVDITSAGVVCQPVRM